MKFLSLLVFMCIFFQKSTVLSLGNSLPKNFRQCRQSDPAVGKCLQGALLDAFKKMKNAGIPSLGVLPLEPLVVNDIKIDPGAGGPVTLKLHFKNLKMYGIPQSNITDYQANFNDARLMTTALTSKLWFEADYNADGKVLLLPVRGSGKCNVTLFDLKTTTDLKFHPEIKNGETYWIIQDFKNKFTPKKVTVYFGGLLKGERRLNSGINQFLNDNWKVVFEELGPSFEEAFGAVFKEITHRVFSRFLSMWRPKEKQKKIEIFPEFPNERNSGSAKTYSRILLIDFFQISSIFGIAFRSGCKLLFTFNQSFGGRKIERKTTNLVKPLSEETFLNEVKHYMGGVEAFSFRSCCNGSSPAILELLHKVACN